MKTNSVFSCVSGFCGVLLILGLSATSVPAQDPPNPMQADTAESTPVQPEPAPVEKAAEAMPPVTQPPAPAPAAESAVLPAQLPFDRYKSLIDSSPFAPATPPVEPVAPKASFAQYLYMTGAGKMGNKDYVSIASRNEPKRYMLFLGEPGTDGMQLEKVEWSAERGKTKATVRLGGEVAIIEFDQQLIGSSSGASGGVATPPVPMAMGHQPGRPATVQPPRPMNVPQVSMPGSNDPKMVQRRRVRIVPPPGQ